MNTRNQLRAFYAELCAILIITAVAIGGMWFIGNVAQRVIESAAAPTPTPTAEARESG